MSLRYSKLTSKECTKCKTTQDISEFHNRTLTSGKKTFSSQCKTCRKEYLYKWRATNPLEYKEHYTRSKLKSKYALTAADVERMKEEQNFCCAICDEPKRLVIDHSHDTGKVRGLLCHSCNTHLGVIENKEKMRRMQEYLNEANGGQCP